MGITRRSDRFELQPIRIEDAAEFNPADYDLTESGDEDNNGNNNSAELRTSRSKKNKERRAERRFKKFMEQVDTDGVRIKSNMGARKHRRVENARILLSYTDREDICLDYSDLVPRTISAFEHLLIEKENMKVWNEFIEKDEEEQRRILETGRWQAEDGEHKEWFVVGGKSTPRKLAKTDDERKHHPAYSARACFEQLDRRSKKLLSERHLPWGFVAFVEKQLREFFSDDASGVFIGHYECSLHRALAHSVAQFLRLTSKSLTDNTNTRITEVRNHRSFFIPPRSELVPYLSSLRPEPIDYVPWTPEECSSSDQDSPNTSFDHLEDIENQH